MDNLSCDMTGIWEGMCTISSTMIRIFQPCAHSSLPLTSCGAFDPGCCSTSVEYILGFRKGTGGNYSWILCVNRTTR